MVVLVVKLEAKIYDSIILNLQSSLQSKIKDKKIENLKKIDKLKLKKINFTEDLNYFEEKVQIKEPFKQNKNVFEDERVHEDFSCDLCPKAFSNKIGIENHLRTHTGEMCVILDECNQCQKVFPNNSHLKKHLESHTCESCTKIILCNQCAKTFSNYKKKKYELFCVKEHPNWLNTRKNQIFEVF